MATISCYTNTPGSLWRAPRTQRSLTCMQMRSRPVIVLILTGPFRQREIAGATSCAHRQGSSGQILTVLHCCPRHHLRYYLLLGVTGRTSPHQDTRQPISLWRADRSVSAQPARSLSKCHIAARIRLLQSMARPRVGAVS